ncbi:hypothetical protein Y032_0078g1158 [Ancylostoma ceylanicum]|uniref:Uncharacterized protein n=1 Tax=Ancylostoma ceylanicum TaxID=53326 RepID=A0A016TUK2_9BILA|nr:hypothetical protein Y032_0078g1158 [Ancylostoma ceylanicum]
MLVILCLGFGLQAYKSSLQPQTNGDVEMSSASDGTVIINGNVVNVAQKLALLKKSEVERDHAKATVAEQTALIGKFLNLIVAVDSDEDLRFQLVFQINYVIISMTLKRRIEIWRRRWTSTRNDWMRAVALLR